MLICVTKYFGYVVWVFGRFGISGRMHQKEADAHDVQLVGTYWP